MDFRAFSGHGSISLPLITAYFPILIHSWNWRRSFLQSLNHRTTMHYQRFLLRQFISPVTSPIPTKCTLHLHRTSLPLGRSLYVHLPLVKRQAESEADTNSRLPRDTSSLGWPVIHILALLLQDDCIAIYHAIKRYKRPSPALLGQCWACNLWWKQFWASRRGVMGHV